MGSPPKRQPDAEAGAAGRRPVSARGLQRGGEEGHVLGRAGDRHDGTGSVHPFRSKGKGRMSGAPAPRNGGVAGDRDGSPSAVPNCLRCWRVEFGRPYPASTRQQGTGSESHPYQAGRPAASLPSRNTSPNRPRRAVSAVRSWRRGPRPPGPPRPPPSCVSESGRDCSARASSTSVLEMLPTSVRSVEVVHDRQALAVVARKHVQRVGERFLGRLRWGTVPGRCPAR